MSRIAVSSQGASINDNVDPRFGRAAYFVVVDTDTMEYESIDNQSARSMGHGAGLQAAEAASKAGAEVVLSGFVGPKAFHGLSAAGIKIGQGVDGMTVREAVERFMAGDVPISTGAQGGGRRGGGRGSQR